VKDKITMTIVVLVALVCAALAGIFAYRQSKASEQNRTLQEQVMTLEHENADLQKRLDDQTTASVAGQHENESLKAENDELKTSHGKPAKTVGAH
jgi:uncharacterized protein YlxW (UPF0749 family)